MSESVHALGSPQSRHVSMCVPTSPSARAKRQIASLMEEVEVLKQDKATKKRKTTFYVSQGWAIRRMVDLYAPIEDLIAENDRRCEESDKDATPDVKAGIRDHTTAFIVSENSWPSFMYENYEADTKNLERGLFKSKLLVMGLKAIFTSPSSAHEVDGEGMRKVTPRAIAYAACQIRFALSNLTSWRTVDGDFDYHIFWNNVVDFFEDAPGPAVRARVNKLLEWWTSTLATQRQQMEDAELDSD
ncbi:hypothetical protein EV424DRAFT_1352917 [Suillus variegatus]|nr:hypothetical protein EV424DRAFT_1352917 [Suillus variegatus]